ncbi:CD151 antigen-like isoform X2 [Clytia hemisphaerica]|uniref:CD151 antigen-like isoform X2 n=1 Tax=Clytia hemisphaerica TaxID=252671 RepID=UPI0034D4AAA3
MKMAQNLSKKIKITKFLLLSYIILFFLLGSALLVLAMESRFGKQDYITVTEKVSYITGYMAANTFCIIIGVIMVIVSFFGCCGVIAEHSIMVLVLRDRLESTYLKNIQALYTNDTWSQHAAAIDNFQRNKQCCGYHGIEDWDDSHFMKENGHYPISCCKELNCSIEAVRSYKKAHFYQKGCFKEVVKWLTRNMEIIGIVNLTFGILQIFGMVLTMILYCFVKDMLVITS